MLSGKYDAGTESGVVTLTVANIDKEAPTILYGENGAINVNTASTTVTISDVSGSGVNNSTLQYVWDSQNTVEPVAGWVAFTNNAELTKTGDGIYYLWIKGADNVGNTVIDKTNAFELDSTLPESPTMVANPTSITNGDVLVTITYSADTVIKQYSTNGTTWQTYTELVVVTENNTTVYAKRKEYIRKRKWNSNTYRV